MSIRLALTLAACLAALAACGESESDKAARALGYQIAPPGGAPVSGAYQLGDQTWSFTATVPEGWRWRKRQPQPGDFGEIDGVDVMEPGADAAALEKGYERGSAVAFCSADIQFKTVRFVEDEGQTQEMINQKKRDASGSGRTLYRGEYNQSEAVEDGAYVGRFHRTTTRREYQRGAYVFDVGMAMDWETVDLHAGSSCRVTLGEDWEKDDRLAPMIAFTRSTKLVPPPKP